MDRLLETVPACISGMGWYKMEERDFAALPDD